MLDTVGGLPAYLAFPERSVLASDADSRAPAVPNIRAPDPPPAPEAPRSTDHAEALSLPAAERAAPPGHAHTSSTTPPAAPYVEPERAPAPRAAVAGGPAGRAATAPAAPAAGRAARRGGPVVETTDSVFNLEPLEELVGVEVSSFDGPVDTSVDVEPLTWSTLTTSWSTPDSLPDDALPPATQMARAATAPPRASAPPEPAPSADESGADGEAGAAAPEPAPKPDTGEAEQRRAAAAEAREFARRSYADLVPAARREQQEFVGLANDIVDSVNESFQRSSATLLSAHDNELETLRRAADRTEDAIDSSASFAQLQLEEASLAAGLAIEAAGRRAYGLINADDRTAANRIATVVRGLVSGHEGAYNTALGSLSDAFALAIANLNIFRDGRTTEFATSRGANDERARNEALQNRIPRWVEQEATRLGDRVTRKRTAWESAKTSTTCSLTCGYTDALNTRRVDLNTQGRQQVARTLAQARRSLREQSGEGRRTIEQRRQSYVAQVRAQHNAAQTRFTAQTRAALGGVRQEAQSAVSGVQAAARASQPDFSRNVDQFAATLRRAAAGGAAPLRQTALGSAGVLQSTRRTHAMLDERLRGNLARARAGLEQRGEQNESASTEALAEFDDTLNTLSGDAEGTFTATDERLVQAFGGLSDSVTQAASEWARPLAARMAADIAAQAAQAATALIQLNNGGRPVEDTTRVPEPTPPAPPTPAAHDCRCPAPATTPTPAGTPAPTEDPPGLIRESATEIGEVARRHNPRQFFDRQITDTRHGVDSNLGKRTTDVTAGFSGGFLGTVDEAKVVGALRGLTEIRGNALKDPVYPQGSGGRDLVDDLLDNLDYGTNDYNAAMAYLSGNAIEGARLELIEANGIVSDDEARMEAAMRALSPEQLASMRALHPDTLRDTRAVLSGTDLDVFNAVADGNYALADAYHMRDEVDEARRNGDIDATATALTTWTAGAEEGTWGDQPVTPDERRAAVVAALAGILPPSVTEPAAVAAVTGEMSEAERAAAIATARNEARVIAYVTRDIDVYVGGGEGGGEYITMRMEGASRDLAESLIRHGDGSVEARAARIGFEIQRSGDPSALNLDRATFDAGFSGDLAHASEEEREAHRRAAEDRARVVMLAAERYAGADPPPEGWTPGGDDPTHQPGAAMRETRVMNARDRLIRRLEARFGSDTVGAQLAAGLLTDARPSPATCALAMRHAMYSHIGTNEELIFRFTERMNRDEVAAMRTEFAHQTGGDSLDAELGVYGEGGTFTELSGDDRLRMERAMLGVARNDRERLEVAAFAIAQQRWEAGDDGAAYADGTLADQAMTGASARLEALGGGPIAISRRGELLLSLPNFDARGNYTGADHDEFLRTTGMAQDIAHNYAARIDAFADIFTTGIAILGAIAAAAITVATGGAALPLIAMAVATGLASMSANYAIKGGRYGWEQAGIDLAMTAVQAVTAGVGAQLGAAAQIASKGATAVSQATRTLMALSRIFTESPVMNAIIIGAITGSISGLGSAALDESTWDGKDPVGSLLGGLLRGALAGAATSAFTSTIENIGEVGKTVGDRLNHMTAEGGVRAALRNIVMRGGARALLAGGGGMIGRSTELLFDSATGRFRGDAGDALHEIGAAGLHSAVQGFGEGAAEAVGGRFHNATLRRHEADIARERASMGMPDLDAETLRAAAHDLMFMNQIGESGALAAAIRLDHVAANGGMEPARLPPGVPRTARPPLTPEEGGEPRRSRAPHADEPEAAAPRPGGGSDEEAAAARRSGGGGGDDEGPPRVPAGGGDGGDDDRLFPRLTEREVNRAVDDAESALMMRIGAEQPGAETRPAPVPADREATLAQRQLGGVLADEADALSRRSSSLRGEADDLETRARHEETIGKPERAERMRARAAGLREDAAQLETRAGARRAEAEEYLSGRRSATAHLPGAEDIDVMFDNLTSESPGLLHIGLSNVEAHPELLPRLVRSLLNGEEGTRVVFRVESERSRELVSIDAHGNVRLVSDGSVHVNAGSFERAMEFLLNNSRGRARLFSFEVDESWIRAARSAAIPEAGTADLAGRQPRLVDVRFADDQLEIPHSLLNEFNRMIVPGSGQVHEFEAVPGRRGGGGGEPEENFGTADQAAAGIRGSRLSGDAAIAPGMSRATSNGVRNTAEALGAPGGALEGRLRMAGIEDQHDRFVISGRTPDEPDIPVRIIVERELPRVRGEMQAARYDADPDVPGGFIIRVSEGTPASEVGRALAHEVRELRNLTPANAAMPDALGAGGKGGRLSPHDEGRLGEIEFMAHQLATLDPADSRSAATRRRIMDEAQRLVDHLGLLGESAAAARRLGAVRGALGEDTSIRALLDDAVRTAGSNPFLEKPGETIDDNLALLGRRLEHARSLGDQGAELRFREQLILDQAIELVMSEGLVTTYRGKAGPSFDGNEIARLRAGMPGAMRDLFDRAIRTAATRPPYVDNDRRPSPGYEARFLSEDVAHAASALPDDLVIEVGRRPSEMRSMRVEEAIAGRLRLLEARSLLQMELDQPGNDSARIRDLQKRIGRNIAATNLLSEALGVAAGRQFVANDPVLRTGTIIDLPFSGSGVPDILVELPGPRYVLVECKGGVADLGTRKSVDGRFRVSQGRREYVESLAHAMIAKGGRTGTAGAALLAQVTSDVDLPYYLVRQPFDIDGAPTTPQVSEFDTRRR